MIVMGQEYVYFIFTDWRALNSKARDIFHSLYATACVISVFTQQCVCVCVCPRILSYISGSPVILSPQLFVKSIRWLIFLFFRSPNYIAVLENTLFKWTFLYSQRWLLSYFSFLLPLFNSHLYLRNYSEFQFTTYSVFIYSKVSSLARRHLYLIHISHQSSLYCVIFFVCYVAYTMKKNLHFNIQISAICLWLPSSFTIKCKLFLSYK